jgi:hypothetical protein
VPESSADMPGAAGSLRPVLSRKTRWLCVWERQGNAREENGKRKESEWLFEMARYRREITVSRDATHERRMTDRGWV